MIFTYDRYEIIITDLVPIGKNITEKYYRTFLTKKLLSEIRKKLTGIFQHGVIISHDQGRGERATGLGVIP